MKVASFAAFLMAAIASCATVHPSGPQIAPPACIDQFKGVGLVSDTTALALHSACSEWADYFHTTEDRIAGILADTTIRVYSVTGDFECGAVKVAVGCTAWRHENGESRYLIFINEARSNTEVTKTVNHEVGHVLLFEMGERSQRVQHEIIAEAGF